MPVSQHRRSRVIAAAGVFAVLALAAVLRLWALGRPGVLVFDELYYVRDAITQLSQGYPLDWPDDDPAMATGFLTEASFAVHPPLGKWVLALGIAAFGEHSPWGWRIAVALTGVVTVAVTMRLGWRISRSYAVALMGGLVLAVDGVHVVLTRVGLLDGILTLCVVVGALFMWRDHEWVRDRRRLQRSGLGILWRRPWLVAAAAAFGCAAGVKWSGLYPLAAFLILATVSDALVRVTVARQARERLGLAAQLDRYPFARALHAWGAALAQALATALTALPIAVATYVATWAGWILAPGGWGRHSTWPRDLWQYHVDMFAWHSTLSAPHPYQAHPASWPLGLRPTAMYFETLADDRVATITPIPNIFITWGGVIALAVLTVWLVRALMRPTSLVLGRPLAGAGAYAAAFVVTGYLSGWLPWVLTVSRSAVFQFYAVVLTPFSALALALVLGVICRRRGPANERFGRRVAVGIFLAAALVVSLLFFPLWSGMPTSETFWRLHLWLPGWA